MSASSSTPPPGWRPSANQEVTQVGSQGGFSKRDAKAEFKAAKAYAKAQRPWYKQKRWILSLTLLALIAIISSGSGDDSASLAGNATPAAAAGTAGAKAQGSSDATGVVGQALTNAGTTYRVTNVRVTSSIGDPSLAGAQADGTFVVVGLTLTNNKNETKTFMANSAKLRTLDGKEYETTNKTMFALEDSLVMEEIQPDLPAKGHLAFDVPPAKLSGSTLVVEDLYGSGDVKVDLGL